MDDVERDLPIPPVARPAAHGRGAGINPAGRFERLAFVRDPEADEEDLPSPKTQFFRDASESLITYNNSPDIGFDASLNIYRGCEHGCSYCFARPFHEYLGCSAGLDFETKIFVKTDAPRLLRAELTAKRWKPQVVVMSGVTDCYQPAERTFKLTRACLEIFAEFRNPVSIITKSALVTRDLPILQELARHHAVRVFVSITTLDAELARAMEPRAASPQHRLRAVEALSAAGIPVGVMAAPMIPGLTDHELPAILAAAAQAGAESAGYVVLRLPYGVKDIFSDWLDRNVPTKKQRVLDRVREFRGGKLYDATWGTRGSGTGIYADQLGSLFEVTARRLGLSGRSRKLSAAGFRRPGPEQLSLF
jgi:DNA repair photolyase